MVYAFIISYRFVLLALLLCLLPACKQPSYNPKPLHIVHSKKVFEQKKENVCVDIHPLTKQEAHTLFDGRAHRLIRKRKAVYPLHLTIQNNSQTTYILDSKNITLKLCKPHHVAQKLHSHTGRRIISTLTMGILGSSLTFFGAAYLIILGAIPAVAMPVLIKAGYITLGICAMIAIGTPLASYTQACHAMQVNTIIDADLREKTLNKPVYIQPSQTYTILLFTHQKSYQAQIQLSLIAQETNLPLHFDFDIPKGVLQCI